MQSQSHSDAIMDIYKKIEEKQARDCEQPNRELNVSSYDPHDTYEIRDPHHLISILKSMRSRL